MFDKLTSMFSETVKDQLGDQLMSAVGLDAEKADKTVKVGTETILDGFKDELMSGNISGLTNLVKGGVEDAAENAIVQNISGKVVGALSEKVGLSPEVSNQVVGVVVPFMMDLLNKKDDDESSFSLGGMFDLLAGNKKEEDAGDLLSGLSKGIGSLFG